jgi:hypothetical protein
VTHVERNPNSYLIQDIVDCVRQLIETFPMDGRDGSIASPKELEASLNKLQEGPPLYMDYLMLTFGAAAIRWAAHETGRNELEMLDEIARSFSSLPLDEVP